MGVWPLGLAGPRPASGTKPPGSPYLEPGRRPAPRPLRDNGPLPRRRARGYKGAARGRRARRRGGTGDGRDRGRPSRRLPAARRAPAAQRGAGRPRGAAPGSRRRRPPRSPHSPTARCPSSWRNLRRLAPAGCSRGPLGLSLLGRLRQGESPPRRVPLAAAAAATGIPSERERRD